MNANETSYEAFAEVYLASTDEKPYTTYYERPCMIKKIPSLKNRDVLDLGCATGYYSKYCKDRGANVIAIDASKKMVDNTINICDNKITGFVHDISKPFTFLNSNSIDIVICSLVFHYLEDWKDTLHELYRVIRPGGTCLISTHHPINDYETFSKENYFDKKIVTDHWKGFETPLKVKYYVRPLSGYIQPILQSEFILSEIDEPLPIDELKTIDAALYKRLSIRPTFLFFTLLKDHSKHPLQN